MEFATIGRLKNALTYSNSLHKAVAGVGVMDFTADTQFFVSAIVRPTYKGANLAHSIVSKRAIAGFQQGMEMILLRNNTQFQPRIFIGNGNAGNPQVVLALCNTLYDYDQFYHLIAVFGGTNSANWKIYVNGVSQPLTLVTNGVLNASSATRTTEKLCIGNYNEVNQNFNDPNYFFRGQIASIYVGLGLPTQNDVNLLYTKENSIKVQTPYAAWNFREFRGRTLVDTVNSYNATLLNYSDTEVAAPGYWQGSQTAYVGAYDLIPVVIPDNAIDINVTYRYEYINDFGGLTFPASTSPFYQVYSSNPGWRRMVYSPTRVPVGLLTFEDNTHVYVQSASLMNKPGVYECTIENHTSDTYWRQGTEDRVDHAISQRYYS